MKNISAFITPTANLKGVESSKTSCLVMEDRLACEPE